MAKQEQVLIIEPPHELTFFGPFNVAISSVMKLSNPSQKRVCFKIKTTAPKRYCVKPNSGVINPNETVQISVGLQPFDFDPTEKNRHKFMVQSMYAPDGEINQDTLWKETDANKLMDSKLKCVFLMPDTDSSREVSDILCNKQAAIPPSPKGVGDVDLNLKRTMDEIKKLQEEVSALRQDNIQLKEEALRQKRLAASRNPLASGEGDAGSSHSSGSAGGFTSTSVTASNPNVTALSQVYIYGAIAIWLFGMLLGKWLF